MADFYVDPTGLHDYIGDVVQTNLRTREASSYAQQWVGSLAGSGGQLFQEPAAAIEAVGHSVAEFLDKAHWVGVGSVTALQQSATMYATTEQENAEAVDRQLSSTQYGYNTGGGL